MARKTIMVTRTVKSSICTVLCVSPAGTTANRDITIAGEFDSTSALQYLQKNPALASPDFPAYVFAVKVTEELYGMSLDCFLKNSIKLPPRTTANSDTEEVEALEAVEA